ncbi:uncharacterized protein LOC129889110 [Solanum dulcamara]|uniref:uncharacterized protein LOC129889110 n=1 Tax=Solanum dulcamara TaxID=45834 RepID=UPI002484F2FA|nr:uncharacterized protein LOC129889110 [Solanum dulcamara]XP_055820238.1 uncharacterized protein LOC129889110 [Solanum dulcamara]
MNVYCILLVNILSGIVMECNKDEALRAKELAEKKMQSNDFLGAQKVALKAERLYPQLENISQLLAVCNVHCSAQSSTVGSEKDWYGILQIDIMADEVTIKKQYRRLALVLHPDKNKFPGAEAAFKLIGESNMVLSDPTKRALYDSKYRVLSKGAAAKRQVNRNPSTRQNNSPNGFGTQSSNLNNIQKTQTTSSAMPETFWTGCPFCNIRYQYYKSFVNRALRCQKCSKPFIAYDLGSQGAPLGPKWSHPGSQDVPHRSNMSQPFQQKGVFNHGTSRMAAGAGFTPAQMGSQQCPSSKKMASQPDVRREKTAQLFEDLKAKGKADKYDKEMGNTNEGAAMPKVNKKNRKRSRKQTVESSESIDTSSSTEPEITDIESGSYPPAGEDFEFDGFGPRRSSRLRQNVSYKEGASDDENDLANPLKKVWDNQSAGDDTSKQKEAVSGDDLRNAKPTDFHGNSKAKATQNGEAPPKANVQNENANSRKFDKQAAGPPSSGVEKVEVVDSDSEPDSEPSDDPPELYECPDPEFSDFDKHREESCFAVDQIWACYDTADGMPRFYCQIRKVLSPEFELRITWLEANPEDQGDMEWVEAELPAGCGKFRRGNSQITNDRLIFSHLVQCEKGKRGAFFVFPREGEIWALFKNWDIGWSSNPEKHGKYKYEIVEVLSDFVKGVGIKVNYLDKVSGFVSLFHPTSQTKVGSFLVKPNELYKFSHQIPSFRMTGTEKEGVPVGSFELDPASLPLNPDDICCPEKLNKDSRNAKSEAENVTTPKKFVELKGMGATDGESSKVRRSPRSVNISMTRKL